MNIFHLLNLLNRILSVGSVIIGSVERWFGGPLVGRSLSHWSVFGWSVVDGSVVGGFNKTRATTEVLHEISGSFHGTFNDQPILPFTIDRTKYSSLTKLFRITAYIKRFVILA